LLSHNPIFIPKPKIRTIPTGVGHNFFGIVHIQFDFAGIAVPILVIDVMITFLAGSSHPHVSHLKLLYTSVQSGASSSAPSDEGTVSEAD
jgi:hypothetical protein